LSSADGAWDEGSPGIDVVLALERLQKAFTGASSRFYDPTKEAMKKVCHYWKIDTPRYVFAYSMSAVEEAGRLLRFPLFVKHFHGYNSVGITERSRVTNMEELRHEARRFLERFGGALIEEFVEGREFSCLVAGNLACEQEPLAFLPVECVFEPGGPTFKTFEYKWKGARNPWVPVRDAELARRIQELSRLMFLAVMNGEAYARTDMRLGADGRLYMLEINPNPSIFYPDHDGATADQILVLDGFGKARFLALMIEQALARRRRLDPAYTVSLVPSEPSSAQPRTVAARDIAPGEVIFRDEEAATRLVSRRHVETNWNAQFRSWFREFCWPLSEGIWGMWSEDPERWAPLAHSCQPNAWFQGLNTVARRPIRRGEPITIDYATLYADVEGPAISCPCDAGSDCRGGWRPDDYRQPWCGDLCFLFGFFPPRPSWSSVLFSDCFEVH
jgi:D-alanine-D-alanine ligase